MAGLIGHNGISGMVKKKGGREGGRERGKQIKDAAKSITCVFKVPGHPNTANGARGQIPFQQPAITQSEEVIYHTTSGFMNYDTFKYFVHYFSGV